MSERSLTVGAWNALVRRARIGRERKAVALTISSYANRDGTGIHCGVATLAVDCEIGYSTARRYLAWMREVGLIELVKSGNVRRGLSDEYQLTLGPDVREHLKVPQDDEYKALKDELREANRSGEKARRMRVLRSPQASAEPTAEDGSESAPVAESALTQASAENPDLRSESAPSALTQDERPPRPKHQPLKPHQGGRAAPQTPRRLEDPPTSGHRNAERNSPTEIPDPPPQAPSATTDRAREPARCAQPGCAKGFTLSTDGTTIERCPDPSHPPPDNVIPFPTRQTA
jgi:hypothetical protein